MFFLNKCVKTNVSRLANHVNFFFFFGQIRHKLPLVTVDHFPDEVCPYVWLGMQNWPLSAFDGERLVRLYPGDSVQGLGIESFPTSHMLWVGVSSSGPLARLLLCDFPLPRPLGPPLLPLLFRSGGR